MPLDFAPSTPDAARAALEYWAGEDLPPYLSDLIARLASYPTMTGLWLRLPGEPAGIEGEIIMRTVRGAWIEASRSTKPFSGFQLPQTVSSD